MDLENVPDMGVVGLFVTPMARISHRDYTLKRYPLHSEYVVFLTLYQETMECTEKIIAGYFKHN